MNFNRNILMNFNRNKLNNTIPLEKVSKFKIITSRENTLR